MKFEWIDWYTEFATKLLAYKNDRSVLIQKIEKVYADMQMPLPKLEHDYKTVDIDPFTVFGLFNKNLKDATRVAIIRGFTKEFNVSSPIPNSFDGIPLVNNLNATFYGFEGDRKENDIENLWNLFEAAITLSENDTEENRKHFSEFYDEVHDQFCVHWKITMGLFWIRPYTFINLDSRNRWYLFEYEKRPADFVKKFKKKLNKVPFAADYLELTDTCNALLSDGKYQYKTFPELSHYAWVVSEKGDGGEEVEPNEDRGYWWLNANPKIWHFSDIKVGEVQSYNLYGEKGKIRKNFTDAKEGDLVIGYESTPVKKVVALARVNKEQDGKALYFEKTKELDTAIDYSTLNKHPQLKNMEYFKSHQGSLFKLTKAEYDTIINLIENGLSETCDPYTKTDFLKEVFMTEKQYDSLVSVLKNKKNIILQGAPGVGKTFAAKRLAWSLMGEKDESGIEFVQFHQNYSYEDFMMGYKPVENAHVR